MRIRYATIGLVGLTWLMAPGGLAAQTEGHTDEPADRAARAQLDAGLLYAHPLGEFGDHIERGFGFGFGVIVPLAEKSPWSLRLDGAVVNYGHESREVCASSTIGCRVRLDLTTTNNVMLVSVGPQLAVPSGPLQPYVHMFAGGSFFGTTSSLSGTHDAAPMAETLNHHDLTFSWGGGGGLRAALPVRSHPVFLDLGARYHRNGRVEYLREGDITDLPDGSIVLDPQRTRADMIMVKLGVTFGFPAPGASGRSDR